MLGQPENGCLLLGWLCRRVADAPFLAFQAAFDGVRNKVAHPTVGWFQAAFGVYKINNQQSLRPRYFVPATIRFNCHSKNKLLALARWMICWSAALGVLGWGLAVRVSPFCHVRYCWFLVL